MVAGPFELPQISRERMGGCNPNARCGNGLEKIYPTCAVRYGYMRLIGEFSYAPGQLFGCRQKVVVQTDRGTEIGEQVSLTCSGCDKSVNREQMRNYARNSGADFYRLKNGRILRAATASDLLEDGKIHEEAEEKLAFARDLVKRRGLAMKLVSCEQLFGGERVIFYFMSEQRVDFRDLVRDLAHEYHTRIDMRQIGHRDEARLVADYEICGRECCCKNFLKTLRPVSMQMAKLQKSTLDPSKVSGRCGRLRCCLRYEHEGYETLTKKLPRVGSRVRVGEGAGTVVDRQILTQLVMIQFDSGKRMTFPVEDLLERDLPRPPDAQNPRDAASGNAGPPRANTPPRGRPHRGQEPRRERQPPRPAGNSATDRGAPQSEDPSRRSESSGENERERPDGTGPGDESESPGR